MRMPVKCAPLVLAALLIGGLCLTLPRSACADSPAAKPATLEQQIAFLEGALTEGLVAQDWKMIQIAVKGFASSGLKEKDLELSLLRAERNAAFDGMRKWGAGNAAQIETFGLAVRSQLGDAAAKTRLHGWGFDDLPEVKMPDPALWQKQPADADKQMKAAQAYQQDVARREFALLALALLKEPGVLDKTVALLQVKPDAGGPVRVMGMGNGGDTLILASLAADADAGFKKMLAICSDETQPAAVQTRVLQTLAQLHGLAAATTPSEASFSLRNDIAATLPKDVLTQLAKPYTVLIQHWKPDDKQQFDMTLNNLLSVSYSFPKGTLDKEALDAILALKDRVVDPQGWMKNQIVQVLKMHGVDANAATKPPAPPKDF